MAGEGKDSGKNDNTTGPQSLQLQGVEASLEPLMAAEGSSPSRTRTYNKPVNSRNDGEPIHSNSRHSDATEPPLAPRLQNPAGPGLAEVLAAWPNLSEAIRIAVVTLVRAAR
jgi:hypothetical protein